MSLLDGRLISHGQPTGDHCLRPHSQSGLLRTGGVPSCGAPTFRVAIRVPAGHPDEPIVAVVVCPTCDLVTP